MNKTLWKAILLGAVTLPVIFVILPSSRRIFFLSDVIGVPQKGVGMQESIKTFVPSENKDVVFEYPRYPSIPSQDNFALDQKNRVYKKESAFHIVTPNVSQYVQDITSYILGINGRILSSNVSSTQRYTTGYLVLKVPVEKFEEANARVTSDVKDIIYQDIQSSDETGTYTAAVSQVENLKEKILEKELKLLEAKTKVEKKKLELEIQRLNTQLKSAESSLRSASDKVEYATITVKIADDVRYYGYNHSQNSLQYLWEVIKGAFSSVFGLLTVLLFFLIWVIVYAIIWLPLILIIKFIISKLSKKNTKAS